MLLGSCDENAPVEFRLVTVEFRRSFVGNDREFWKNGRVC